MKVSISKISGSKSKESYTNVSADCLVSGTISTYIIRNPSEIVVPAWESAIIDTGVAIEVSDEIENVLTCFPQGTNSMALQQTSPFVSGKQVEIKLQVWNMTDNELVIRKGRTLASVISELIVQTNEESSPMLAEPPSVYSS